MMSRVSRLLRWVVTVLLHPRSVRAGRGAAIYGRARVKGPLDLGAGAIVLRGLDSVGPVVVGAHSFINAYAYLRPGVVIGDAVSIGSHVRLITDSHEVGSHERRAGTPTTHPVVVGDGAWIGSGVTVLPGVTVGAGAVVAAGSVVVDDVAPDTLVGGVPARTIRSLTGGIRLTGMVDA